jgi:hypothetical protein
MSSVGEFPKHNVEEKKAGVRRVYPQGGSAANGSPGKSREKGLLMVGRDNFSTGALAPPGCP